MAETDFTHYVLTNSGWEMTMHKDGFDGSIDEFDVPGPHYATAVKTERSNHTSGFKIDRSISVTVLVPGKKLDQLMEIHGKEP